MKKQISFLIIGFFLIASLTGCYERIDAGHAGVRVNLYGDDKGVDKVTFVTGAVWYNPFTTEVYEFPTFTQTCDYAPFIVNSKDASEFTVDPTLSYYVVGDSVPEIFKQFRKQLPDLETTYIKNIVYDSYRIAANTFTSDEIMANRQKFEELVQSNLSKTLSNDGFIFQQMTSQITPPASLKTAIDAKNQAIQQAMQAENEVKKAEANAKIKVATEEGNASALKIKADAEAYYNKTVAASITPILVQQQFVDSWDGKLPVYGEVPTLFRNIDKN